MASNRFKQKRLICFALINVVCFLAFSYSFSTRFRQPSPVQGTSLSSLCPRGSPSAFTSNHSGLPFRTNIFFLKTHKTGSSTVQNILMRFGLRNSLDFLLPRRHNYLGYGHPIYDEDLDEVLTPPNEKFHIFAHHSRYRAETNLYLYNDTIRVTILRYPPRHFDSIYHHFKLSHHYGMSFGEFLESLPNANVSFDRTKKYLKNGYNQMSFDLGLQTSHMRNESLIRDFIHYVDQQFTYIMITEYMEASLVMLADLMGWPLRYVSSVPLMQRGLPSSTYELDSTDEMKISSLNKADAQLYDYFLKKFRQRVLRYGLSRLLNDMNKLRRINEELANACINSTDRSGYGLTVGYKLKDSANWDCVHATKSELRFTAELRAEQAGRLKPIKNLCDLINGVRKYP